MLASRRKQELNQFNSNKEKTKKLAGGGSSSRNLLLRGNSTGNQSLRDLNLNINKSAMGSGLGLTATGSSGSSILTEEEAWDSDGSEDDLELTSQFSHVHH